MKKTLALCCLLVLTGQTVSAQPSEPAQQPAAKPDALSWTVLQTWKTEAKPLDFVQSLDGRMVFVLGGDSKVHLHAAEGQKLGEIPVEPGTVAIDIAPRGEMLYLMDGNGAYKALDVSFAKDIDIAGSPFLGKEAAPVAIVVFSDFQCPFCARGHQTMEQLRAIYGDQIRFVFKHFPLPGHPLGGLASRASFAAMAERSASV